MRNAPFVLFGVSDFRRTFANGNKFHRRGLAAPWQKASFLLSVCKALVTVNQEKKVLTNKKRRLL